ncbi:MAG: phosphoribosylaminoimidazole-succinocarboxamide synthase [Myxococcales bacterium]
MLTLQELEAAVPGAIRGVDLAGIGGLGGEIASGKVRDMLLLEGKRVLVTTDRVSAFDRVLGVIPYKGQVLTELTAFWLQETRDLVANHLIAVPDPNVMVVREAAALPVEVVVRGHITGVTDTALWTLYERGVERPYGLDLPAGLRKNDRLPEPVVTPTTKAAAGGHDERLTSEEVVSRGLVEKSLWQKAVDVALAVFRRGQEVARAAGFVLVDTKYELGLIDGDLALIDEVHTPDSSRFWRLDDWERGGTPEHWDKEFLRLWFAAQGYRGEGTPPVMPAPEVARVAERYIAVCEGLTGRPFVPAAGGAERIRAVIEGLV